MIDNNIKIIKDARFDSRNAGKFELALNISRCSLTAMINDVESNKIVCFVEQVLDEFTPFDEYCEMVMNFIAHDSLQIPFSRVRVVLVTTKSTLVPESLIDPQNNSLLMGLNHDVEEVEEILTCNVKNGSILCLFVTNAWLKKIIVAKFPGCTIFHQCAPLIDGVMISVKNKVARKKVFVNVENEFFDLVVVNGENLLLHNTFPFQTDTDFVFYLMSVFEQLKLNPQVNEVTFSGNVDYDSSFVILSRRFVKNVNFVSFTDEKEHISYAFDVLKLHKYVNLVNVFKCE